MKKTDNNKKSVQPPSQNKKVSQKKQKQEQNVSKNVYAEQIVGLRNTDGFAFDQPCELGYHCPVCKYPLSKKGEYDERLHWSEYNGFIWCEVCNKDYPSVICQPNIDKAIETYLQAVRDAQLFYNSKLKKHEKDI